MPQFGKASLAQRATLHPKLQRVLDEVIKVVDVAIVEGHRGKEAQNAAVRDGLSKVRWPNGKHNSWPSRAADLAPWPIDWRAGERPHLRFAFMMGVVYKCARDLGIRVRFGMDWNQNFIVDESFVDLPHVELHPDEK